TPRPRQGSASHFWTACSGERPSAEISNVLGPCLVPRDALSSLRTGPPATPQGPLMIIFDAHLDLAWNAIDWNRDLRLPAADIRKLEREQGMTGKGRGCGTVSFPELRRGKVALFIATLLARLLRPNLMPAIQRYSSMEAAYACAHGQLAYYRALEQEGWLRWIKDWPALEAQLHAWQSN